MRPRTRIAIVGVGKIARDQHLPALAKSADFDLVATASRSNSVGVLPAFPDLPSLLAQVRGLDAVSLCTPPQGRHALVQTALEAGLHVMIEKPPGATVVEVQTLAVEAHRRGLTLFASWHSREAAGVEPARRWLTEREIRAVRILWKEDVRVWHPGQEWIFEPGGLGVFDPAINALSIATHILPGPLVLEDSVLSFPENRAAPIAATLRLRHANAAPVTAELDFLQTGPQSWDIEVDTDAGTLQLRQGGAVFVLGDAPPIDAPDHEYPRLYRRFRDLIERGESDVDLTPLQLVADAYLVGRRTTVGRFDF
ncbi:MAG TPA: galactose 1-dehydrogenase [Chloroflexi bacterium]|jgi:predicted dehydrogenase|nr:galactose 1-dehydrogenase [Chloroflexota bacterium]